MKISLSVLFTFFLLTLALSGNSQKRPSNTEAYLGVGGMAAFENDIVGLGPLLYLGVTYEISEKWRVGLEYSFSYYSYERNQAGGDSTNNCLCDPAFPLNLDRFFDQAYNHDVYLRAYYTLWDKLEVIGGFSPLNYRQKQEVVSLNGVSLRNGESARFMFGYHYDVGVGWRYGNFGVNGIYSFVHRSSRQKVFVRVSYHFGS